MKKRMFVCLLAVLLVLSGCSWIKKPTVTEPTQETAVLYFANADGTDLTPVNLDIKNVKAEELPAFLVQALLDGPKETALTPSLRPGTQMLSISSWDDVVNIDFSKEFYHEQPVYDILAVASVVKSLCSLKTVSGVFITVEGAPLQTENGESISILTEADIVFDADALMQDESNVILYFSDPNAEYLVREIRRLKVSRGDPMEKLIVSELIKGPEGPAAARTIPPETKLLSVETKEGVCFVNLSSEFISKNNVGTSAERLTIYSIVNSLTELSNIDKVQFLIEGEKKEVYHHMIFNEPIERDISMIRK